MSTVNTPEAANVVRPPKKNRRPAFIAIGIVAVLAIIAAITGVVNLTSANPANEAAVDGTDSAAITEGLGSAAQPVRIGTVGASEPYWQTFKDAVLAEGISVDIIDFASYPEPNPVRRRSTRSACTRHSTTRLTRFRMGRPSPFRMTPATSPAVCSCCSRLA